MSRPLRKSAIFSQRKATVEGKTDTDGYVIEGPEGERRARLSRSVLPPEVSTCCGLRDRWDAMQRNLAIERAAYLMVNRR